MKYLIETKDLHLRKIDPDQDDLNAYLEWLRDIKSNPYILGARVDFEYGQLKSYIKEKNETKNALLFGIFLKQDKRQIGTVKLEPIDFDEGTAWIGLMIGDKDCRGRGHGFRVISELIEFAKKELNLKKIFLGVDKSNLPALNLYHKAGFKIVSEEKSTYYMSIEL